MPSKKKKYNARFPPARIKKIMQSDEEVGKVAQAVPVIISRALELFVESLLRKAETVTNTRNAKTLTPPHLKQCILAEQRFDFLKDLVSTIPDVQGDEESAGAETPRSSTAISPFVFPPVSVTSTSSYAGPSSAMSSTATGPVPYEQHGYQSSDRPSTSYEAEQIDYRHVSTLMTFPTPPPPHYHQQDSVIVSHSSILNPVGANSNPYIPINHPPLQSGAPPRPSLSLQQTMAQQFECHLQQNLSLALNNGIGGSDHSIPFSLSARSSEGNSASPGVIVYDRNASNVPQPHYKQESE